MGAVLLCTKCKPGPLNLTKAAKESCEGASRAHAKRKSYGAQKYLQDTTAPANLFSADTAAPQTAVSRAVPTPASPAQQSETSELVGHRQAEPKAGCGPHTAAKPTKMKPKGVTIARKKNSSAQVLGISQPVAVKAPLDPATKESTMAPPQVVSRATEAATAQGPAPRFSFSWPSGPALPAQNQA